MPNILMPALSPTMEEGKLSKWLVKVGDMVKPGDVLAEIETDKATMEVESVDTGRVDEHSGRRGHRRRQGQHARSPWCWAKARPPARRPLWPLPQAPETATPTAEAPAEAEAKAPAAPAVAAPKFEAAADPDLPAGVEMVEMTVRQALNEAMAEEMRRDEDVFIMGEEVAEYQGAYKVTQGLLQEFGAERVVDTPITEHGFAGIGVGAAFAGLRPIVEFMTWNFAMQAIDQIINSAAKQLYMSGGQVHAPIVFRGPNGVASRVGAQHSQDYSAWYSHVPASTSSRPTAPPTPRACSRRRSARTTRSSSSKTKSSTARPGWCPRSTTIVLPIGKARVARAGKDVTIVSFSMGMRYATQATEKLVAAGVDVELIDLRTLRPMDSATVIESVKKTGRIVTVEEGWPQGGIGAELVRPGRCRSLRLSRRAADAGHRQGRADALRRQSRKAGAAQRRRSRRGGERRHLPELTRWPRQDELDRKFLDAAYEEAQQGLKEGGIPIGSVLVRNGEIIGRGHNRRVQKGDPILHGEMDAIQNAGRQTHLQGRHLLHDAQPLHDVHRHHHPVRHFPRRRGGIEEFQGFPGRDDARGRRCRRLSRAALRAHDGRVHRDSIPSSGTKISASEAAMSINITMPALSPTMEEGKLAKWHVKEGDTVSSGDVIAEIETDKATMEVEAVDEGKIGKIVVPEGTDNVKVNAVIAVLLTEGETRRRHEGGSCAGTRAQGRRSPQARRVVEGQ